MDDILGTVGDVLSAPRRGLWYLAGAPFGLTHDDVASGHALLSRLGMDPNSPWTNVLGLGADILGDPLTWGGGLITKALMGMRGANIATKLDDVANIERAAMMEMVPQEAAHAAEVARQGQRFEEFRKFIDPDSLMRGDVTRTYANVEPALATKMEEMGLGTMGKGGSFNLQAGYRPEFELANPGNIRKHSAMVEGVRQPKGNPPPFTESVRGRAKYNLQQKPGMDLPTDYPSSEEMNMLRRALVQEQSALPQGLQGLPLQNIHNPINPAEVFQRVAMQRAGQIAPVPQMTAVESQLPGILDEISQLNRRNALLEQLGMAGLIGGGAGLGIGAGSYLGGY